MSVAPWGVVEENQKHNEETCYFCSSVPEYRGWFEHGTMVRKINVCKDHK
jgi:hypothetical protein